MRNQILTLIVAVAAFFLVCLLLTAGAQSVFARSNYLIANGFVVRACAGLEWQGRVQFGLGWYWPGAAYGLRHEPPFYGAPMQNHIACAFIPWLPILPGYGTIIVPP